MTQSASFINLLQWQMPLCQLKLSETESVRMKELASS